MWKQRFLPDDCLLVLFENKSKMISIARWTKENDLVILKTNSLNKTNVLTTESTITAPVHAHVSINTVDSAWTVCELKFKLYRCNSKYACSDKNYSTADKPSQIIISFDSEHLLLSPMTEYKQSSGYDKIRRLSTHKNKQLRTGVSLSMPIWHSLKVLLK